jgi:glycosyltransferase involved in cell wall biosynthesis
VAKIKKPPSVSIVIPVFNNEDSLQTLISGLGKILGDYSTKQLVEVIFVDDGSRDNSVGVIRKLSIPRNFNVTLATHKQNHGQLKAIYTGFRISKCETVVHLTADLQDPAGLILDFINEYRNGFEIVYGIRQERKDGIWRRLTSSVAYKIAQTGNAQIPKGGFDYFLISSDVKADLLENYSNREFIQGSILKTRANHRGIPYVRLERAFGKSQWTFRKKLRLLFDILIESTFAPIRMLTYLGTLVVIAALGLLVYFLILRVLGMSTVTGFTTLALLVISLGGLNLLMLGLIAEYLIRLIKQVSGNHNFVGVEIEKIK